MEKDLAKELSVSIDNLTACFFFEDFELSLEEQKKYQVDIEKTLGPYLKFLVEEHKITQSLNVNITLCSDEYIIELNESQRNKAKVTDVLSFPLQENLRAGDYDKLFPELELGDIFICHNVCTGQAKEFKITYSDEFIHLLVHGLLHLAGYDHEINDEEEKLMESLENKVLDQISNKKD